MCCLVVNLTHVLLVFIKYLHYNYFIHHHPLYNILKYFYHSVFEHQQPIIVRGPSAALKPTGALALLLISRYLDGQT